MSDSKLTTLSELQPQQPNAWDALDAVSDGFIEYDPQWRFVLLNRAAEHTAGRPRESLTGKVLWEEYPELEGGLIQQHYLAAQRAAEYRRFEYYAPPSKQWLDIRVFPSAERIVVVMRDITALHEALDYVQRVNRRYAEELTFSRAVSESIAEGVYAVDANGDIVYMNPTAARLLKLDPVTAGAELRPRTIRHEAQDISQTGIEAIRLGCTVRVDEAKLPCADGSTLDVAYVASPLVAEGQVLGAVVVLRDLRDEKQVRAQLLERDHLFELSVEVFFVVHDGQIVQANPAAYRLFDWERAAPLPRWRDLVDAEHQVMAVEFLQKLEQPEHRARVLLRMRCSEELWIEWNAARGDDGSDYLVGRDVTERHRTEVDIRRMNTALAARNRELQDFAHIASHDLQEPLRKIRVFGERLEKASEGRLSGNALDYLSRMLQAAMRMQALIDGLLAYSRLQQDQRRREPVDLNRTIAGVLNDLELKISGSGASVQIGTLPKVMADPTQMRQLLQNLVQNALKFVAPGERPQVQVSAEESPYDRNREGRWFRLCVRDQGIGFDPAHKERIFAPFQRLRERGQYEGSGIGLAIVRRIVEQHGGTVTAESEPGQGSRFIVELQAIDTDKAKGS